MNARTNIRGSGIDWLKSQLASPQVQVALDLTDLKKALLIANKLYSVGIRWIEAGTPLIKSQGIEAVRKLKTRFPRAVIVADMKTLDAGALESEIAFDAGADVVSISGLSHERTIVDSITVAKRYDGRIMADLLMSENPRKSSRRLERLGVHILCVHTGIDTQVSETRRVQVSNIKRLMTGLKIPVAAAGGVNPELASQLVRSGVSIVIVGGWITRARNPMVAAKRVLNSISKRGNLGTE